MKTDGIFYHLCQKWPQLALNLLGFSGQAEGYRFVSEEIKQTGFRIDGIFQPDALQTEQPIIFIEVQFQADPDFYGRFYSEIILYLYRHKPGRSWLAWVIYPLRSIEKPPSIEFAHITHNPQIKQIYLEDFLNNPEPNNALFRLIACPESETVDLAQAIIKQTNKPEQNVIEFIETILVYKLPKLTREEIRAVLGLNNVELKQTRFYQEIAEEERQEGRLEGKIEGRLEGRLEGESLFLQRLLNKRFSPLPDWVNEKLKHADTLQIESWGDRLLDAKNIKDIFD